MKTLAVICIVKNEEKFLATALASVKNLATEIIVVDSGSTDNTVNIAKRFTDKVFQQNWLGYGPQKNFAVSKTNCDFILQIDADEEITSELNIELRAILETPQFNFYWLRIITVFLGRPLKHLAGNNLRLFSREHARWNDSLVHEQVVRKSDNTRIQFGAPDSGRSNNFILHHSHYQTIAGYKERQEKYSSADAEQMLGIGKDRAGKSVSVSPANPFSRIYFLHERAFKQLIRKFIRQRGILDGWQGWLWCLFSAQYEYKMCRKYLALLKQK
ncbi:MAG: glycosyltransferase family 2 protein [bacterium]|nr:glycosyltransferase family 2 protein [bacterium]